MGVLPMCVGTGNHAVALVADLRCTRRIDGDEETIRAEIEAHLGLALFAEIEEDQVRVSASLDAAEALIQSMTGFAATDQGPLGAAMRLAALDPVTLAVVQSGLVQVCNEMDLAFCRSAFSPVSFMPTHFSSSWRLMP